MREVKMLTFTLIAVVAQSSGIAGQLIDVLAKPSLLPLPSGRVIRVST
ncbi:MAG: hypothetical protein JWM99_2766, partial [Verrucomicrobiales bacterium]|nr:hypothetical protein [Verrucomicrobiales bacterium]